MFHCVVRYGFKDVVEGPMEFEEQLVEHLKEFIWHESYISQAREVEQSEKMVEQVNPEHSAKLVNDGEAGRSGPSSTVNEVESQHQNMPHVSSGSIQSIHMDSESTNSSTGMVTPLSFQRPTPRVTPF